MVHFTPLEITALVLLGLIALRVLYYILSAVYIYFIKPAITSTNFKAMGKWALVTGSTDGIGKQYAKVLAARGCNIILLSRSLDKLKNVAVEIENEYKVATKVVQADLTKIDELYDHIANELKDLEIGVLVNNAGMFYPYPEYFLDVPDRDKVARDIVNVNIVALTQLVGLVMPGMVSRKRGVVVNIGSTGSRMPAPLLAVYAASKAYVDKFTQTLQLEYKKSGVIIQNVYTGTVVTKMGGQSGIDESSMFSPSAEKYSKAAVRTVGVQSNTTGYYGHAFMLGFGNIVNSISPRITEQLALSMILDYRKRALKNLEKAASN